MKSQDMHPGRLRWTRLAALLLLILAPGLLACDATALGLDGDDGEEDDDGLVDPNPPTAVVEDGVLAVEWQAQKQADRHDLFVHYQYWNAETFRDVEDSVVVTGAVSPHQVDLAELSPTGNLWRAPERVADHEVHLVPGFHVNAVILVAVGEDEERSAVTSIEMPTPELIVAHSGCIASFNGIHASSQLYGPGDSIIVYWGTGPGVSEGSNREKFTGDVNAGSSFCLESDPETVYYYRAAGYNDFGSSGLSPEIFQEDLR